MGHTVELAKNGEEALSALARQDFTVVLMDCQMPVLDGYQATRRIRSGQLVGVNARVPIVALTAYAREEDRARCFAAGMDAYVSKPIRVHELHLALEQCGFGTTVVPTETTTAAVGPLDLRVMEIARGLPGLDGPSLLPELVALYRSDENERLTRLDHLLATRAGLELAHEAHSLAGNAASFGGHEVQQCALDVEESARAGAWPDALQRTTALRAACARLRDALDKLNLPPR
jgi:CheY-like chemotaxis protein